MRVTTTTTIEAPADLVFDAMADARNEPQWNSRVSNAELQSSEPIGLGSQFVIVNSGTSYDLTITRYEAPAELVFEGIGRPNVTIAYSFRSSGDGTDMTSDYEFRPGGISRALFAVLAPVIRREVRKQLASFKTLCES
jgi:uncharacterized protein YndB with AHSA1/START domain